MNGVLISKKDLLEVTGVSYGQLYRWKRKNLIPEEWFIRKSTFTGQETFFPKDKMLERIEKIKDLKDGTSLDDLAQVFSPKKEEVFLDSETIIKNNMIMTQTMNIYKEMYGEISTYSFENLLSIYVLEKTLQSGNISLEEAKVILETLEDNHKILQDKNCEVIFARKFGISVCFLVVTPNEMYFEKSTKLVFRLNISECIEELKFRLNNISEGKSSTSTSGGNLP